LGYIKRSSTGEVKDGNHLEVVVATESGVATGGGSFPELAVRPALLV
jgi:hypothetical protein